jgi:acyl-coenzyme A thioesterase PaaI-like protein
VTGLEMLRAMAAGELPGAPIADLLGFEPVEAEEGRVVFAAIPDARHSGGGGGPSSCSQPPPQRLS